MKEYIKNSIWILIKSYFYIVIWILYFIFYSSEKYKDFANFFESIKYWDIFLNLFNWIIAAINIVWIILLIILFLNKILKKIFEKTKTKVDDLILEEFLKFLNQFKVLVALFVFTFFSKFPDSITKVTNHIFLILFAFLFVLFLSKVIWIIFDKVIIKKSVEKNISKSLMSFLKKVSIVVLWIIWIITILSNMWFDVTALMAWAWVWWVAIAFAAKQSIANIFWAITILLNKPFQIWDYVDISGVSWTIQDIWLTYITIESDSGSIVMIPNETIISTNISNSTMRSHRKAILDIWLVYWTSLEKMQEGIKIVEDILENYLKDDIFKSYRVIFDSFWDFSLNLKIAYYTKTTGYKLFLKEKETINLEIKKQFEKANLDMAFPTQELILKKD